MIIITPEALALLACPVCHGALVSAAGEEPRIACRQCSRHYPIVDGIPVLIAERAQALDTNSGR